MTKRLIAIDFLRGSAVTGMILYHFLFDLAYFTSLPISMSFWPIAVLGAIVRLLFISIVGTSLYLASKNYNSGHFIQKTVQKSGYLSLFALSITGVSWLFFPESYIRFGVLHLLSAGMLISIPFVFKPKLSLFVGIFIMVIGFIFFPTTVSTPHLWWLGFIDKPLPDLDYFPLIPWVGVLLVGIWIGSIWQQKIQPRLAFFEAKNQTLFFASIGKNALLIYLLHQPILIVAILLVKYYNR
jgi:uncharacterized membrane protein